MAGRKRSKPKEAEPRWGHRPPGIDEYKPLFTDPECIIELADLCGIKDSKTRQILVQSLEEVAESALTRQYIQNTEVSNRDQRVALQELTRLAESLPQLIQQIEDADSDTRRRLFASYRHLIGPGGGQEEEINTAEFLNDDLRHVKYLYDVITDANASLPVQKGPQQNFAFIRACELLIPVYERFSGKTFTYDREPSLEGSSTFLTAGADFVAYAAKVMFPEATEANIATAIRTVREKNL